MLASSALPPLAVASETERSDLAVEVAVSWGGDLLRVVHLDPPRDFDVGALGADLVFEPELLGTERVPLVRVRGDQVTVLSPRGAPGSVFGAGERLDLVAGGKVTVVLPSRGPGAAYRARGSAEPTSAPVILEVSLVRAGKRVGRNLWPRVDRLFAACLAATLAAFVGVLVAGALAFPESVDDHGMTRSQADLFQRLLTASAERELEEEETEVQAREQAEHPQGGSITLREEPSLLGPWDARGRHAGFLPYGEWDCGEADALADVVPWDTTALCKRARPEVVLSLSRWASARDAAVVFGEPTVVGALDPRVVDRISHESTEALRMCFGLESSSQALRPPSPAGVEAAFIVDAEGRVHGVEGRVLRDIGYPTDVVTACVRQALEGSRFPGVQSGTTKVKMPIRFLPRGG